MQFLFICIKSSLFITHSLFSKYKNEKMSSTWNNKMIFDIFKYVMKDGDNMMKLIAENLKLLQHLIIVTSAMSVSCAFDMLI